MYGCFSIIGGARPLYLSQSLGYAYGYQAIPETILLSGHPLIAALTTSQRMTKQSNDPTKRVFFPETWIWTCFNSTYVVLPDGSRRRDQPSFDPKLPHTLPDTRLLPL